MRTGIVKSVSSHRYGCIRLEDGRFILKSKWNHSATESLIGKRIIWFTWNSSRWPEDQWFSYYITIPFGRK